MTYDGHKVWCDHHGTDETHDDELPYCMKQINGIKLIPIEGEKWPPGMWVYATAPANPAAMTSGDRAPDDHIYDGIEVAVEHNYGDSMRESKFRMTSSAARSLAAALIRAADVREGLTR